MGRLCLPYFFVYLPLKTWMRGIGPKKQTAKSYFPEGPVSQKSPAISFRRLRAVSLFSLSVEQNARDTQMTTHVTEGARRERHERLSPSFLASRGFAAQRSRARALPLLNLKKNRGCSQSKFSSLCVRIERMRVLWVPAPPTITTFDNLQLYCITFKTTKLQC